MRAPMRWPQAGHPTAFLIQHEHGVPRQHAPQCRDQRGELRPVLDIAGKQDDPGGRVAAEQGRLHGEQFRPGNSDDGGFHRQLRGGRIRGGQICSGPNRGGSLGRCGMAGFCASRSGLSTLGGNQRPGFVVYRDCPNTRAWPRQTPMQPTNGRYRLHTGMARSAGRKCRSQGSAVRPGHQVKPRNDKVQPRSEDVLSRNGAVRPGNNAVERAATFWVAPNRSIALDRTVLVTGSADLGVTAWRLPDP